MNASPCTVSKSDLNLCVYLPTSLTAVADLNQLTLLSTKQGSRYMMEKMAERREELKEKRIKCGKDSEKDKMKYDERMELEIC